MAKDYYNCALIANGNFDYNDCVETNPKIRTMEPLHNPTQVHAPADLHMESGTSASDALSKEKHQRLFQRGLKWLCVGIVLMAVSFGINFLLFHSEGSFAAFMYALTTLGTVCIVKGLVDIMGF